MKLLNYTPHSIDYINGDTKLTIPSVGVARVSQVTEPEFKITLEDGVEVLLTRTSYGDVVGLPNEEVGTFLIVSAMVKSARPDRHDLVSPSNLIRNDAGQIIGCAGFDGNYPKHP